MRVFVKARTRDNEHKGLNGDSIRNGHRSLFRMYRECNCTRSLDVDGVMQFDAECTVESLDDMLADLLMLGFWHAAYVGSRFADYTYSVAVNTWNQKPFATSITNRAHVCTCYTPTRKAHRSFLLWTCTTQAMSWLSTLKGIRRSTSAPGSNGLAWSWKTSLSA